MEFLVIAAIALLIGSVFGWISFFKIKGLEAQVTKLANELTLLRRSLLHKPPAEPSPSAFTRDDQVEEPEALDVSNDSEPDLPYQVSQQNHTEGQSQSEAEEPQNSTSDWEQSTTRSEPSFIEIWFSNFKDNWMLWMGGLSLALAGVFLARYAIQHGVLGPLGRIISGIVTGLVLHVAAEYLRRRTGESHPSFAMLAAGGSIGLFATLLAALHLYQMISPTLVFVVLAIVALATMWMSLLHGPILAAMGMVGAYVLPILVSTGEGNVNVALLYSLIITLSLLLLLQYVKRYWLWYGMAAGSLLWWLISLDSGSADLTRQLYLACVGYAFLSIMQRNWSLSQRLSFPEGVSFYRLNSPQLEQHDCWINISLLLVVVAQIVSILAAGFSQLYMPVWLLLNVVILSAAMKNAHLAIHVWLSLLGFLSALLLLQLDTGTAMVIKPISLEYQPDLLMTMGFIILLFCGLAYRNARAGVTQSGWAAMTLITPVLVMLVTYLLLPDLLSDAFWTLSGLLLGALYVFLASTARTKAWSKDWEIWLYLSGHFAYSFAAVVFFEAGTLTLAIALQVLSLALIIKRYEMSQLGWLLKLITSITVIRLSANPWLVDYPTEAHWTVWTYGGSFLAVFIASRLLIQTDRLRLWLEGAAMHLLVLTIWVEIRYYLYDGMVFTSSFSFTEAALMTMLFGLLSLIYYHRASFAQHTATIYRLYSSVLMIMAVGIYALIIIQTLDNDVSVRNAIATTPIWNIMLIAYGFPVLLAWLAMRFYEPQLKQYFEYMFGFAAFVFINLEIRHLWQGNLNLRLSTTDGEFYTYSVFWLVAAIVTILISTYRLGRRYYKLGMTMLALVVFKVFFFDMSQLDGVYRIISFMGLGLCLLAMAYLHKRLMLKLEQRES